MKKQIDPNLDNFDSNSFSLDEGLNKSESKPEAQPALSSEEKEEQLKREHSHSHHEHSSEHTHHHSSENAHHHHSSHHHKHNKKRKKLPTAAKVAIAILIILLTLTIAFVGTFLFLEHRGKSSLTGQNVTTQENYDEKITYKGHNYVYNKDVVSIAFIGVDKRELGLENGVIGTAGQADANILLTVDTKTGRARAIAIPRDTIVEVDLYSENNIFLRNEEMQLCLSYAYGNGKDTSATNVTTSISRILLDIPINKYFALDLNGIAPINDAIGGVTVTSIYDFNNINIKKGDEVHLIGNLTEKYVRTRNMDDINASLNRTARQVQYIKAFAAQLVPAVMNDFSVVSRLYNTATKYSSTNISLSDATYLASLLISKGITDFETETLQGEMKPSTRIEYEDVVYAEFYPDEEKLMETVLDTFYTQID